MACCDIPSSSACEMTSRRERSGARMAEKPEATLRNGQRRCVARSIHATGRIVTSVIRSDLVDAMSILRARWRMNSSLSPPSPRRYTDALLVLVSFALILAGLLASLW